MIQSHFDQDSARVRVTVLTASDTRSLEDDESGSWLAEAVVAAGFDMAERAVMPDGVASVRAMVEAALEGECDVVLVTGGTGPAQRDCTPEAVETLIEKRLDGFGELFRALSFEEIGPSAAFSRALAGTVGERAVFVLPGSPAAVRLAWDRLISPSLGHLVGLLRG